MSKLKGLKVLQSHFEFNGHQLARVLLYKNLPSEKIVPYQGALGRMVSVAMECGDIEWALNLIRLECLQGLTGTEPEGYDPYYGGDGNPPLDEPRPYDAYTEIGWHLHPDDTPHALGLALSPSVLSAIDALIASKVGVNYAGEEGASLMTYDEGLADWRVMTKPELTRYARQEESRLMADCLFTVDFNSDMARLRQLVAERGSFQEILDLIGPEATDDEMPF